MKRDGTVVLNLDNDAVKAAFRGYTRPHTAGTVRYVVDDESGFSQVERRGALFDPARFPHCR